MSQEIQTIIQQHHIVLFDEVCVLCNGWVRFLLQHDQEAIFKIASVQSPIGQKILAHYNMPLDHYDTMLTIHDTQLYTESTAFLKVMQHLGFPFRFVATALITPRPLRDFGYKLIAQNRYRLFGQTQSCLMPSKHDKQHFLEEYLHD